MEVVDSGEVWMRTTETAGTSSLYHPSQTRSFQILIFLYSGNLNSEIVQYSDHGDLLNCQMVHYSDAQ